MEINYDRNWFFGIIMEINFKNIRSINYLKFSPGLSFCSQQNEKFWEVIYPSSVTQSITFYDFQLLEIPVFTYHWWVVRSSTCFEIKKEPRLKRKCSGYKIWVIFLIYILFWQYRGHWNTGSWVMFHGLWIGFYWYTRTMLEAGILIWSSSTPQRYF